MKVFTVVVFTLYLSTLCFNTLADPAPQKMPIEYPVDVKFGKVLSNLTIKSTITGVDYPYHIYLPNGFDASAKKRYPVIYASDAQWVFNSFAQKIDAKKLGIILIGIEEGPRRSGRRNIDYKLPGTGKYIQFFIKEFMPLIESNYLIDAKNRSLQGASYGGLLSLTFMLAEDAFNPLFKNILSYDATVQVQDMALLNIAKQRFKLNKVMDVNLIMTGAMIHGNLKPVKKFIKKLNKVGFENLHIYHKKYNVNHGAISNASFDDSLDIIMSKGNN